MVRWWAAFFVCGLVHPPAAGVAAAAVIAAAIGLAACIRGVFPMVPPLVELTVGSGRERECARLAVIAAGAIILWQAGGLARLQGDANRFGAAVSRGTKAIEHRRTEQRGRIGSLSMREAQTRLLAGLEDGRLSRRARGFVGAIVLGDRRGLAWGLGECYSYLGISHFLALSGLHLGAIAFPVARLLSLLLGRRAWRDAALVAILALYASIACFPPSLVRALALSVSVVAYRLAGVPADLYTALIAGSFMIAVVDGDMILETAFQLSFAAVLAIALIALPLIGMIEARLPRGLSGKAARFAAYPVIVTCAVQFATLPIVLATFGRAPVISPLVNVFVSLPFAALLYAGALYVFAPIPLLRAALAPAIECLCRFLDEVPAALARGPLPAICAGDGVMILYGCGVAAAALALAKYRARRSPLVALAASCVILSFTIPTLMETAPADEEKTGKLQGAAPVFLDGQGYVYCAAGGGVVIIGERFGEKEARVLLRGIWEGGRQRVARCVLVPHALPRRHGVFYLARRIEIDEVFCNPYLAVRERARLAALSDRGARLTAVDASSTLSAPGCTIAIEAPPFPPPAGASIAGREAHLRCVLIHPFPAGARAGREIDPDRRDSIGTR